MTQRPKASDDDVRDVEQATDDTEGHSMLLDPSTARHLARSREQDIQRATRDRQREKDVKK